MKKVLLIFVAIVFTAGMLVAQEEEVKDKNKPNILFEKTVHDFGTIPYGGDGTCEFVFKNTGKDPLVLSNVKSSCGCTVPVWPKEPVKKGKTASIKVKYNTKRQGQFTKTITVFSNANSPMVRLTIKGKVEKAPAPPEKKQIQTQPVKKVEGPVRKAKQPVK